MSFIIGNKCVSVCDTGCVDACPVDCIHGPIKTENSGKEVDELRTENKLEGLQLHINPAGCIECGACLLECPPRAIYESEKDCIEQEGNDVSVRKNYDFFNVNYPQ